MPMIVPVLTLIRQTNTSFKATTETHGFYRVELRGDCGGWLRIAEKSQWFTAGGGPIQKKVQADA